MASTLTTGALGLEKINTGEQAGTWGDQTNVNLEIGLEIAIAGTKDIAVTTADVTLTIPSGTAITNIQSRAMALNITGVLTGNRAVIVPAKSKSYVVTNSGSGAYTLTVKTAAGPGAGVVVSQGDVALLYCDGTNVVAAPSAAATHAATTKATPVDADELPLVDSATTNQWIPKKLTWANLKTTLAAACSAGWNAASATALSGSAAPKIPVVTATVGSSALTIGMTAQYLDFRSATITSGAITTINCAPTALVVPATATLGTVGFIEHRLAVVVINNAGTAELAVANTFGLTIDEGVRISTTLIDTSSDSAAVWYSAAARTNVAFRVVGYLYSTQDAAGTWASAPSNIQGISNSLEALTAAEAVKSGIPQNSQSANYTAVLGDANKHILHPAADPSNRTFTIPANSSVAFPIGTTLTFVNQINTLIIAITSDTLTLAGIGTTGSRTLNSSGMATAIKVEATKWVISGSGLS